VISVEGWTTIRYLHAQGMGARTIAKKLGLSRNTVRAAIRAEAPPARTRAKRPNKKLAPFAAQIREMLFEKEFIGTRILRELGRLGYTGGPTALYDYLAELKEQRTHERASARFETGPGEQAQFDWSPYHVEVGSVTRRVVVFGLILAYSRRKYYLASLDETQGSAFEALERGLAHFGGAPKRLLVDNAKVFVDDARPEFFKWNERFLELCGHYQMEPQACQIRRAQTKGKIERPFFYLEEQFIKGSSFADLDAMNAALARFGEEELDQLIHGTTQERPLERFGEEEGCLLPLPTHRFVSRMEAVRQVSRDCLISYGGSRYSVPHRYAGMQVWVRAALGVRLEVYDAQGEVIARHELAAKKGQTVLAEEHYAGLRQQTPLTKVVLSAAFLARFPDQHAFLEGLLAHHRLAPAAPLRAVLELAATYPDEALRAAFTTAVELGTYTPAFVRGVLAQEPVRAEVPARLHVVLAAVPAVRVARSLAVYQDLLTGTGGRS
jgi:transposase